MPDTIVKTRRDFMKAGVAATAFTASAAPVKKSATDWVTLGKSGVKVTRLAHGDPPAARIDMFRSQLRTGASIHGLPALRTIPGNQWSHLAMIRMNHNSAEDRDSAMRFAMNPGAVDAVTMGFTAPWQIDEAIGRIARVTSV